MVLLFIQIINNYQSSFINNCWLGLDSIIKYQSEIEDKVIVALKKVYLFNHFNTEYFFLIVKMQWKPPCPFYLDSNSSRTCKRLDKRKRKRKSYSISQ
jgi:hypothetical protein